MKKNYSKILAHPWLRVALVALVLCVSFIIWNNGISINVADDAQERFFLLEETEAVVPLGSLESVRDDQQIIYIGIHVDKVYQLSLQSRSFSADGFIWLEWSALTREHMDQNQISPIDLIRLVNRIETWDSTFETTTAEPERLSAGRYYQRYRFSSRFYDDTIDFERDPFASLDLPIVVELAPSSMSNKYASSLLIPHHHQNGFLGLSGSLSGYQLDRVTFEPYLHRYPSRFGQWYQPTIAQARLDIIYHADFSSAFVSWVLPLLIVMSVVLLSPSVSGSMRDVRLAIPSTALLTLVFLQQAYHDELPPLPYLTLLDQLFACSYIIAMGLFVLFTWGTNVYSRAPADKKDEVMQKIDGVDTIFQVCSVGALSAVAIISWVG